MKAGDLDRRIVVERFTATTNAINEQVKTWATLATLYAAYEPLSDGEMIAAGELGAHQMARFTVRWSATASGITPADRLTFGGSTWNIKGAKEAVKHGRRRFIEITAAREV